MVKRHDTANGMLAWTYIEGPPRRSLSWYLIVVAIGFGLAGLLYVVVPADPWWAGGMLLWVTVVTASSLAPSRSYLAQLDGQLLYVWDVKRNRTVVERNLREFVTYRVEEIAADRLNRARRKLILQRRDGQGTVELFLEGDEAEEQLILDRIMEVVLAAPQIAPTILQRVDRLAQRWVGWR